MEFSSTFSAKTRCFGPNKCTESFDVLVAVSQGGYWRVLRMHKPHGPFLIMERKSTYFI